MTPVEKLEREIVKLKAFIDHPDQINLEISNEGVYWHIDHSLKFIIGVCNTLKQSNPNNYKWRFNLLRLYVFTAGNLPRGKGKAPISSITQGDVIHKNMLNEQMRMAFNLIKELEELSYNSHYKHQYFKVLNLSRSIKFLIIHTNHHLRIANDIVKNV